ncbi:MAG: DUF3089 domain-containing protein [Alphaproteobacteria bacterium]|nr:DUF3089 domain-containing protein [Alphaproteobacteria bacterium]
MWRLFAWSVGVGAVLALLALAGAYFARDNLIRYTLNPGQSFELLPAPFAPEYSRSDTWAVLPTDPMKKVDVFFITPTLYFSSAHWNAPIDNSAVEQRIQSVILPIYAAPFSSSANLFLPRYRQAAPYSFMSSSEDGRKARELAYHDVKAAFDNFLADRNEGRPFIVAGYGQGALYGLRLLSEMPKNKHSQLIAAYLIDAPLPVDTIKALTPDIPLCAASDLTGCIIAWHVSRQGGRGDMATQNALVWRPGGGFEVTRSRPLACVNPLTWTISGRAGGKDMNLGGAELDPNSPSGINIIHNATGADCWNGLLFIDIDPDPLFFWTGPRYEALFPSRVNPFYSDIRANVQSRIESYLAQASLPAPPKSGDAPDRDDR